MADKLLTASSNGRLTGQRSTLSRQVRTLRRDCPVFARPIARTTGCPSNSSSLHWKASRRKCGSAFARPQGCTPGPSTPRISRSHRRTSIARLSKYGLSGPCFRTITYMPLSCTDQLHPHASTLHEGPMQGAVRRKNQTRSEQGPAAATLERITPGHASDRVGSPASWTAPSNHAPPTTRRSGRSPHLFAAGDPRRFVAS